MKAQPLPGLVRLGALLLPGSAPRCIDGVLPVRDLGRVADRLTAHDGTLTVSVRLAADPAGHVVLSGTVQGRLWLPCQRCLEPCHWDVALQLDVVLIDSEAAEALLPPEQEAVVVDDGLLRLPQLIEDEVLLGLPLVPRHVDAADCIDLPGAAAPAPRATSDAAAVSERPHPFAALDALRRGGSENASGSNDKKTSH